MSVNGPNFCWTLPSFLTLSGSFFSLFATDGLKYFKRSSSFLDRNAAKVKSGFDAVADDFCTPLREPFSLSIHKLIILPHLWQKIEAVAHFSTQNEQNIVAKSNHAVCLLFPPNMDEG